MGLDLLDLTFVIKKAFGVELNVDFWQNAKTFGAWQENRRI